MVYYLQLESYATPTSLHCNTLRSLLFSYLHCSSTSSVNLCFHFIDSLKQSNCILQEYTRLTLPAHWNSCWSARYWYTDALISSFGLHLALNRAEIRSRSHVSATDVTRVFKIHRFSNHTSVYSSSLRLRLFRDTAWKAQPQLAHFTHQVDLDR